MHRLLASAVVVLAAVFIGAGCGGSDEEAENSATVWAGELCTAFIGWREVLTSTAEDLRGGNISSESLEGAAEEVKTATDTLVRDLKDLPKPDTEAGEQAKESVDQLADDLGEEADKIESAVEDASGSGVSGVVAAVTTVGSTLTTMGSKVTSTVDDVRELDAQGELEQAFEDAVPCSEFSRDNPG